MLDFNDAPIPQTKTERAADQALEMERLRRQIAENGMAILAYLLPHGVWDGKHFIAADISGDKGRSLKVTPDKGFQWKDFGGDHKGGDLISLWQNCRHCDFKEAVGQIKTYLGNGHVHNVAPLKIEKSDVVDLGPPTGWWFYRDENGKVICKITRYDPPGKKKIFIPFDAITGKQTHPDIRPLYNIPGILKSDKVVLVEGEKCAEALIGLGVCATTAMGGSNTAIEKVNWSHLAGKSVVIWPDNDETGKRDYAERIRVKLAGMGCNVSVLPVPEGKPEKWDAADAVEEGFDVLEFLNIAPLLSPPICGPAVVTRIVLSEWNLNAYQGPPPKQEWLVDRIFPLGTASVFAAAGGSGKGMLGLHLALQIVCEHDGGLLDPYPKAFGNDVLQHGTVVVFSAEDDRDELHRRISGIDPDSRRELAIEKLIMVPLPNLGGPAPIVVPGKNGPEITDFFRSIHEQLMQIKDLKLVIFDPLSSFASVDISASRVDSNFVLSVLSSLAVDTGASVIAAHHFNKMKTDKPIMTPEQARVAISGSAAVVDGSRVSYCLWPMDQDEAKRKCRRLSLDYQRDTVFAGAVVKQNCPVDKSIKTFIRAPNGLLYVMDDALRNAKDFSNDDLIEAMVDVVRRGALSGRPFTVKSRKDTSLHNRREELPVELRDLGRDRLVAMLNGLIESGEVKKCVASGSKAAIWLDVPGGPFYEGRGVFEPGFVEI